MTKKEKQLFDAMMEAIHQKNLRELEFIEAKRAAREAIVAYKNY